MPAAYLDKAHPARLALRKVTSAFRRPPELIIPGAMKAGTTSLYEYLQQHNEIGRSLLKEVKYFDTNQYGNGWRWYRAHFPIHGVSIDASTSYLLYKEVAERIARFIPNARIIVLLRDPAERAWSHYRHQVTRGREHRPFEVAIAADIEAYEREGLPCMDDYDGRQFSYVRRGLYAEQLTAFRRRFPVLTLKSEDLFADPQNVVNRVCRFAELPPFELIDANPRNRGSRGRRDLRLLHDWFAPHNAALRHLGISWKAAHILQD